MNTAPITIEVIENGQLITQKNVKRSTTGGEDSAVIIANAMVEFLEEYFEKLDSEMPGDKFVAELSINRVSDIKHFSKEVKAAPKAPARKRK